MVGQKCKAYNAADFKLKAINFTAQSKNLIAAYHFALNEKQVQEWRKKKF